jgi:hypothetical protein
MVVVAMVCAAPEPKADPKAKSEPGVLAYSAPLVASAVVERSFHGNLAPYVASPYVASPYVASPYVASPYVASRYVASPHVNSPYLASPYVNSPYLASPYSSPLLYR